MAAKMRVFHPPREPGTVLNSVDCKPKRVLSRPIWGVLGALVGTHSLIDIVLCWITVDRNTKAQGLKVPLLSTVHGRAGPSWGSMP